MIKTDLIFDWQKLEGSFRSKVIAFLIVVLIFTVFFGFVHVRVATAADSRLESASILRFRDDELGRFWALQAEEEGPFPGRLELDGFKNRLSTGGIDGSVTWSDYRSNLKPLSGIDDDERENLSTKGARVFPSRRKIDGEPLDGVPVQRKSERIPRLIPYDPEAIAWLPDKLPDFKQPDDSDTVPATWRFILNLREDGTVRESISLGGGDGVGQAMEGWLHGVSFKRGSGDRWLALRLEFVNQAIDGTDTE